VPLLAIERTIHDIARVRQGRRELTIEIRVIFNNKKAQDSLRTFAFKLTLT
jgi:hypothetical protein